MASTVLSRTQANGTSSRIFTASIWFKRSPVTNVGNQPIWSSSSSTGDALDLLLAGNGEINFEDVNGNAPKFVTTRKLRDPSAWYHVVVAVDSTQATDTNRVKIYLNGVQETVFGTANYPTQNMDFAISTSADTMKFGSGGQGPSNYFNGLMSYVAFVDGTAYDASYFGETNAATGIWKIKTSPSVTYGTNGFFLKMDTTSPGSDTSGNNNTFTASGTPTLAQDNASNNLVTMNPLCNVAGRWTITNGNNTIQHANGGAWTAMISSIASSVGKYYMETKITAGASRVMFGVMSADTNIMSYETNLDSICLYYNLSGGEFQQSGGTTSGNNYGTFADNDIAGIALDCTNNKISIYKNGTALVTDHTIPTTVTGPIGFGFTSDSNSTIYQCNYGNGFFGTTAVASSNADAAGHGLFEYAVPTGYYTLNTKNLNTYG